MAVTSQQIIDFLLANPGMSDAQIVAAMEQYGVSPAQMATAVGLPEGEVAARAAAVIPNGQTITLGDTVVQPVYQVSGSGMDQQVGGLENVITYKATDNRAGGAYTQYTPTGEVEQTGTQQEVKSGLKEFALGAGLLFGLPTLLNAGAATGAAATVGTTGLTAAEIASLTAGDLAIGGGAFAVPTAVGATAAGLTAAEIAALTAQDLAIGGGALAGTTPLTAAQIAAAGGATTGLLTPAATTAASTLTPAATAATALTPAAVSAVAPTAASVLTPAAIAQSLIPTAVKNLFTPTNIGNVVQAGTQTAAGLLQQQTSREAAQKAQAMIDAETAAAKQAAAFRPIGMTTRFGTSQFAVDPVTGQLTSAGYTLSPEAKNAQDRLVKLAESGLQQAEGAQKAFEPLQTGAQSLFKLGQGYLAKTPESVASDYMKSQLALLAPGREQQYAFLQNQLQQQGRGGLSVAQGTGLAPTSPELAAFMNAKIQEDARLAANAQQYGQQNVLFGAGLLGQGSQAMGQYYGGQQAAYTPYTTALGQVQGLEQMAQQPFGMSTALAQQASQAGANVGRLGLSGAEFSTRLATSPAATTNPYSTVLGGVGSSNQFGQFVGGLLGGQPATSGFSYGQYGTGVDPSTGEYFGSLYF
jgi:hypothetical protein